MKFKTSFFTASVFIFIRREENISNKNLYTVLSGRCSPFPYVVTLLYHTNIDNCVTKTRIFSEFSILLCVVINNVFENLVNVTNL